MKDLSMMKKYHYFHHTKYLNSMKGHGTPEFDELYERTERKTSVKKTKVKHKN